MPSRRTFSNTIIPHLYDKVREETIIPHQDQAEAVSLTMDMWTSREGNESLHIENTELRPPHDNANISRVLKEIIEE